jgi:hypothetical protein
MATSDNRAWRPRNPSDPDRRLEALGGREACRRYPHKALGYHIHTAGSSQLTTTSDTVSEQMTRAWRIPFLGRSG